MKMIFLKAYAEQYSQSNDSQKSRSASEKDSQEIKNEDDKKTGDECGLGLVMFHFM